MLAALVVGHLAEASSKPLQVYILAGQSNMQGHAKVSTFEHIGMDVNSKPMLDDMQNSKGDPKVCDRVWISTIGCADTEQVGKLTAGFGAAKRGPKIGPEFTFGITMEKQTDAPILIIKTAWGGKSLHTDFRPPSAGPYEFNEAELAKLRAQSKDFDAEKLEKEKATGVYYRQMIAHVNAVLADIKRVVPEYDSKQGYELSGFVWFQGWNDLVDGNAYPRRGKAGGYSAYSDAMAHLIRDVRKDLKTPKLPFVIGVMGVGGPTQEYGPDQKRYRFSHQSFRDAMAAPAKLPEFKDNVTVVLTEKFWDPELTATKAKANALRKEAKQIAEKKKLNATESKALYEKINNQGLSAREQKILEKGISNAEYHYLGSAKILGAIGQEFARVLSGVSNNH
ncbi:hypothetical protein JO972_08725 [Verrucomicrobiaceae bacterium 5K15]|uniref:Sialate O-acetylesterase domain-containing protein n=2 Tax=Oceaniferula flava TaxID=2800421 RepID=A0AAE2SEG0_9BACT|nr:hypothetical protein [Oceaniferula flavus]MBM1136346.1 hypothetical protein [Oceaniferula flavus]